MADFQTVMKQWRKMCEKYHTECMRLCPICANPACGELPEATDEDIRDVEDKVMQWAASHPEPVYPTWGEYLHALHNEPSSRELSQHIPADIAEKLGIEPKEG